VFEILEIVLGDSSIEAESPGPKELNASTSLLHLDGVLEEVPWC